MSLEADPPSPMSSERAPASSACAVSPMMARAAYEKADSSPEPVFDNPGNSVVQQTVNGTIQY